MNKENLHPDSQHYLEINSYFSIVVFGATFIYIILSQILNLVNQQLNLPLFFTSITLSSIIAYISSRSLKNG